MVGTVYLVGAGPGDPGLVTARGLALIRRADCILYDRLAARELLSEARPDCERIDVGKENGRHTLPQGEIEELLMEKARQYACVVRLKGGDAYVFGRGGEEGCFLREHGIPFVVVPGVSSAIAGPESAGIPVTHRDLADGFRVITAHSRQGDAAPLDFSTMLNESETLVFLMGLGRVAEIAQGLRKAGRAADTPAAVISRATTEEQQVCTGTLEDIAARVRNARLSSPAVIVVGAVVSLQEKLGDGGGKPLLAGCRCLLPKIGGEPSRLGARLREKGAHVDEVQVGEIARIPVVYPADCFAGVEWLIFTSRHGVDCFFENLFASGLDARALAHARLAAVGTATAEALSRHGLRADLIPERQTGAALAECLLGHLEPETRVSYPCAAVTSGEVERLLAPNCELKTLPTYENKEYNLNLINDITLENYNAILFTCASCAERLLRGRPEDVIARLNEKGIVYSIGEATTAALRQWGIQKITQAKCPGYEGMVQTLCDILSQ